MGKQRLFTKSKYKRALTCPTKLFYLGKPHIYKNKRVDDDFLIALARGGLQVGALAQAYYPEGITVDTLDHDQSIKETDELLKRENVIIFEAAFRFENLFVRADILKKNGNRCELIEVKGKSADPKRFEENLWNKNKAKKGIKALNTSDGWREILYDIAFQQYVAEKAHPELKFYPHLMCVDNTKKATVDGLNQRFLVDTKTRRTKVRTVGDVSLSSLGEKILATIDVAEITDCIFRNQEMSEKIDTRPFEVVIKDYADAYVADKKIKPPVDTHCKKCEFRTNEPPLKSGFNECWAEAKGLRGHDFDQPFYFDIWFSPKIKNENIIFMKDVDEDDLGNGTRKERQWLQVQKIKSGDNSETLDRAVLESVRNKWTYPLHFIDFETCTVALPFCKGQKPYSQIAFQFSHHIVDEAHNISHADEYIDLTPGKFPNFDFVRALKKALSKDSGTIFMYANHENSVLRAIHRQLDASQELDKNELMGWIDSVTKNKTDNGEERAGKRAIVDMVKVMLDVGYYLPPTNGSNSLKAVLPALLSSSSYIKEKYGVPIYGKGCPISSHNFDPICWVQEKEGVVQDPYKMLPPVFNDYDRNTLDLLLAGDDEIDDGGSAMIAYALTQFSQMSDLEREKIKAALLKYCELDTLAMVLLWDHWQSLVSADQRIKIAK